jgi:NAD(P)-dependent dehydrogenase (short-subunit alcohol dehydrogenase family)
MWEVTAEEFSRVVDVNLKGTASVMRAFLPAMVARRSGVVVNFSSGWGRGTAPEVAPYCATKWAVEGLSQSVAQEVPSGVAVLAVNPGIIHTEMLESCFGPAARSYDDPEAWAQRAGPFLLKLGSSDNGTAISIP